MHYLQCTLNINKNIANFLKCTLAYLSKYIISEVLRFITPREDSQDHRRVRCQLEPVRPRLHLRLRQRAAQGDAHVSERNSCRKEMGKSGYSSVVFKCLIKLECRWWNHMHVWESTLEWTPLSNRLTSHKVATRCEGRSMAFDFMCHSALNSFVD